MQIGKAENSSPSPLHIKALGPWLAILIGGLVLFLLALVILLVLMPKIGDVMSTGVSPTKVLSGSR
jgi:hypothetical protein